MPPDDPEKTAGADPEGKEGGPSVTEREDAVVIDFSGAPEMEGDDDDPAPDDDGKDKDTPPTKPDDKPPSVKELIQAAKEELDSERGGKTAKQDKQQAGEYTPEQLDAAEDRLDEMLEEGEITRAVYRQYARNIQKIRDGMKERDLVLKIEQGRKKQTAREGIEGWARENAPEFLDARTKEHKEAQAWAEQTLGVEDRGDFVIMDKKIASVAFGVLWKGQQKSGETQVDPKEARQKGYEEGLKAKKAREDELRGRDTRVPKDKGSKAKDGPLTAEEKNVTEMYGIKNVGRYRKMRDALKSGRHATVEVK